MESKWGKNEKIWGNFFCDAILLRMTLNNTKISDRTGANDGFVVACIVEATLLYSSISYNHYIVRRL